MLKKVISGGQTGVDQAALRAAKRCGFETGGYIPKGFKTLDGPNPSLGKKFGLIETATYDYALRTSYNVKDSDCTLRIASNWHTPGERCTLNAIRQYGQAHFDLSVIDLRTYSKAADIIIWLRDHEILNVAGNSEKSCPGIGEKAEEFLTILFEGIKQLVCRR